MSSRRVPAVLPVAPTRNPWEGTELDIYRSTHVSMHRELRGILTPHDLLLTDYKALHLIAAQPTRPSTLASWLDVTPATATQLMDRLEQRGLLRRLPDPSDRRATLVRLTREGTRLYGRVAREVRAMLREIADAMTPEGLDALRRGNEDLRRVLAARAPG